VGEKMKTDKIKFVFINKIRDFIIGFSFKKYGHFKSRLDKFVISYVSLALVRNSMAAVCAAIGAAQVSAIMATPAKTKEDRQKKALSIAQGIINTNQAIIKAYSLF
jgi:hypothetical protein